MRQESDETLLKQLADGNGRALGELARRYEKSLLGMAKGIMGGRNDLAQDAVQESWVRVIRFAQGFDGRSIVKTWLYRIVMNQCRSLHAARPSREKLAGAHQDVARNSIRQSVEQEAISNENKLSLREAVATLTEEKREVILLCYHEGLTHEETAEVLDIPLGTVKSRLNSALNALREIMPVEVDS